MEKREPVFAWTSSSDEVFPESLLVMRTANSLWLSVQGPAVVHPDSFRDPGPVADIVLPFEVLPKLIEALQKLEIK